MLLCFHWNVFKVRCCVFHWIIFDTYIQVLPDYKLIWFIETKLHKQLIIHIVKQRP